MDEMTCPHTGKTCVEYCAEEPSGCMHEVPHTVQTGRIRHECTVWCGPCGQWQRDESTENKRVAARTFRGMGWKLTREHGWLCPVCAPQVAAARAREVAKRQKGLDHG